MTYTSEYYQANKDAFRKRAQKCRAMKRWQKKIHEAVERILEERTFLKQFFSVEDELLQLHSDWTPEQWREAREVCDRQSLPDQPSP